MFNEYEELYCPEIVKKMTNWPQIEVDEIPYNFHDFKIRLKGSVDNTTDLNCTQIMEVSFLNVGLNKRITISETHRSNLNSTLEKENGVPIKASQIPSYDYHVVITDIDSGKEYYYDLALSGAVDKSILEVPDEPESIVEQTKETDKNAKNWTAEDNPFDTEFDDIKAE